jgi:hypothetical protein
MRYFKTTSSKILCTFQRCAWMRHEIIYRSKDIAGNLAIALHPSPEVPSERDHGPLVEIDEAKAMAIDPGLFRDGFQDYEEMKRLEPDQGPATARKLKIVREIVQEALF